MSEDKNYLVRGILIGGSLGVLAGVFGLVNIGRGAALGMIGGFFAGITLAKRQEKRQLRERDEAGPE
jgi:membrane associated rhomboid family serine protease